MRPLAFLKSWLAKKLEDHQLRRVYKSLDKLVETIDKNNNSEEREVIRNTSGIKED